MKKKRVNNGWKEERNIEGSGGNFLCLWFCIVSMQDFGRLSMACVKSCVSVCVIREMTVSCWTFHELVCYFIQILSQKAIM